MKPHLHLLLLGFFTLASARLLAQTKPVAPSNLTGTAPAYNKVILTWKDNSTNETKFEIEQSGFPSFTKIGEVTANITTYTDNTTNAGGTYRVRAINALGASTYSNEFTINTPPEPPGTPTNLVATLQGTSIKVTWNNGSGGTPENYFLERSYDGPTTSGFTQIAIVLYSRTPTYTDTNPAGGYQYCYRVRAPNTGGTSSYSNSSCQTTPNSPSNLTNLMAKATSSSQIVLTWNKFGKESGIGIERRTGQTGAWAKIANTLGDNGTYTDNGLNASTEYCYRISEPGHDYSAVVCATTQATPVVVPIAPYSLGVLVTSDTQLQIYWNDSNVGTVTFELERATKSGGPYTVIATDLTTKIYDDKSLTAATQYCYRVRAKNSAGYSGYSNEACGTTKAPPVGAPTNLVATAASTTQINLTWTGVSGAASYQLERSPNGNDSWTKIADPTGSATSYSDPNLTPNTRYYYRLRAVISGNAGPYSNVANALTPDVPPAAPARLSATAVSFSQINLAWADLSANETGFQLERSPNGNDPWTKIADLPANATTYSDQGLQAQTHYFYRIRAVNAAGQSAYSNTADATTPVGPPAAPQNLVAAAASTTQINLTWSVVPNAETIQVERSPNGTDSWTKLTDVAGTTTTYQDKALTPNVQYFYRIRAINVSGTGPYSNIANAVTPDTPPTAPARLVATVISATQINLAWADLSANESGFEIERSPDGNSGWAKAGDALANATSFQNTGLMPNTHYFYRIRAVNAAGQSAYSNTADATTPDVPPAAPANLVATPASATQVSLTWADGSANETGFEVERGNSQTGVFTKIADLPANTVAYEDKGLTPAAPYCYRVRAKNAIGTSAYSNVSCATTPDVPPAAPARLTVTPVSPTQLNLAWADLSTNESGFDIERGSTATGTFTKVADAPANATTYEDKSLTDNTAYCYRIRAKNAAGSSAYSDAVCATTPLAPPVAPINLVAQVFDYDQVKLTWDALSAKAVTVSLERSTDPNTGFKEIKQQPAAVTAYIDMGLQEFTTYYYRIKAINAAGGSGYSNVATAKISEVPIAVEDELETHTIFYVNQRLLHITTNWFTTMHTTIRLVSQSGQPVLTDARKVNPADTWSYDLNRLPTGIYIIAIGADGRLLTKRILLP